MHFICCLLKKGKITAFRVVHRSYADVKRQKFLARVTNQKKYENQGHHQVQQIEKEGYDVVNVKDATEEIVVNVNIAWICQSLVDLVK